ncbi:hypothetical protein H6M51_11260 [Rhizobium sp. AQ_MP]|uniref:hypothetical protein n=1 Tax=Rhizobium sp. AQ_MP TaxID=2761536 RepID=UPI001639CFF3|nr:hypothetical protein [Rhizobium sp. AQ_MP]MBC2773444.1 hypothetical protein [Rhizobium sp. AQ_MP]
MKRWAGGWLTALAGATIPRLVSQPIMRQPLLTFAIVSFLVYLTRMEVIAG